jgi:hypothetical protein
LSERSVSFFDELVVSIHELLLCHGDRAFDIDEKPFEFVPWLVIEITMTVLADVLELLSGPRPAVPLLVILAGVRSGDGSSASNTRHVIIPPESGSPHHS